MLVFNFEHLVTQMSAGIAKKLNNIESDSSVKPSFFYLKDGTLAVTVSVDDIEINVPGFMPNRAKYSFEFWYKGVVCENGSVVDWNDNFDHCWSEMDGLLKFYVKDTFDESNPIVEIKNLHEFDQDRFDNYGLRHLAAKMEPLILAAVDGDNAGFDKLVRYTLTQIKIPEHAAS